jgi:hypothetical protein
MNRARVISPVGIGNSVLLVAVSVLFAAVWVRSYSWRDTLFARAAGNRSLEIDSLDGQLFFSLVPASREWDLVSWPRSSGQLEAVADPVEAARRMAVVVVPWGPMIVFPDWYFVMIGAVAAGFPWMRLRCRAERRGQAQFAPKTPQIEPVPGGGDVPILVRGRCACARRLWTVELNTDRVRAEGVRRKS